MGKVLAGKILTNAFIRKPGKGQVYLVTAKGEVRHCFPMNEDFSILLTGGEVLLPGDVVELIHPYDLGITEVEWA
jgi:hypothetical protein